MEDNLDRDEVEEDLDDDYKGVVVDNVHQVVQVEVAQRDNDFVVVVLEMMMVVLVENVQEDNLVMVWVDNLSEDNLIKKSSHH